MLKLTKLDELKEVNRKNLNNLYPECTVYCFKGRGEIFSDDEIVTPFAYTTGKGDFSTEDLKWIKDFKNKHYSEGHMATVPTYDISNLTFIQAVL